MKRKPLIILLIVLLGVLWLAQSTLAMSSTHYKLEWFTPLTGGGGPASSTHYAMNFTVGQSVIGFENSTHYGVGLGYWYGLVGYKLYLPLILK